LLDKQHLVALVAVNEFIDELFAIRRSKPLGRRPELLKRPRAWLVERGITKILD